MPIASVPAYRLYGDSRDERLPDALHIEPIVARSAIHNWRIRPHRHQDLHQFFLISEGGGAARIDGVDYPLGPGTTMLITPFVIHEFRFEPGTIGTVASVAERTLARLFEVDPALRQALAESFVLKWQVDHAEFRLLQDMMQAALAEFGRHFASHEITMSAHAALLATWFARAGGQRPSVPGRADDARTALVRRFVERVEARFKEHDPLADYAGALRVSLPHLTRCCRETLGLPPIRIIHDRLMLEARRQLVYTSMAISQIAFALGFSDPAYFSRFFAARAGQPPSAYRAAG